MPPVGTPAIAVAEPTRWVVAPYAAVRGAATGTPGSARWMSARISAADWYRSPGSLAIALSTMASAHAGISGSTRDGGIGFSRTCW